MQLIELKVLTEMVTAKMSHINPVRKVVKKLAM